MIQTKNELISYLHNSPKEKVIYGAANVGQKILEVCNDEDIKISSFIDDNPSVYNKKTINGIPVCNFDESQNKYPNADIIVGTTLIRNFSGLLNSRGVKEWFLGALLLEDICPRKDAEGNYLLTRAAIDIENAKLVTSSYITSGTFPLNKVSLVLTEKCTLKCKNCAGFYPYITDAQNYEAANYIQYLNNIMSLTDTPLYVNLSGGETFLYPQLDLFLNYVAENPQIKRLVIISNGTVIPDKKILDLMVNEKILLHISDYGDLSSKLSKLCQICQEHKIWHYVHKANYWWPYKILDNNSNLSQEQLNKLFHECTGALDCGILRDGKFFICPVAESADRLGKIAANKDDYLDFTVLGVKAERREQDRQQVIAYYRKTTALKACAYCLGQCKNAEHIPVAEQL